MLIMINISIKKDDFKLVEFEFKDRKDVILQIAESGYSLRGFSNEIGVSQGYLSLLLKGKKSPSAKVAYKIALGLSTKIEDLFLTKVIDKTIIN